MMNRCLIHKVPVDEYGDCPYCLDGTLPPGMDEIDFYRQNVGPGEVCRHDPEMLFRKEKKDE